MDKQKVFDILNSEMELATGCTEPAAIALTAATASKHLGEEVESLEVRASVNMIKNAMAAGIPGTCYTGIEYAAAIGAVGGNPEKQLEVIDNMSQEVYDRAEQLVNNKKVTVGIADSDDKLYIDVLAKGKTRTSRAVISGTHTNVTLIEENGKVVFESNVCYTKENAVTPEMISETLSVEKIVDYINTMDVSDVPEIILKSIEVNSAICEEGLKNDYGLKIGKTINEALKNGFFADDMATNAMIITSAGADARMAGAPISVVSNSGSGNQGITATMPVVACARWLKSSDEKLIRAVTLSNLIAIYIKSKFGRLSALCGATVASTGASCGITYLFGGGLKEISYAIHNMIGNVTGMLCDGAKADCALKISTCTNAAVQAAIMAMKGLRVKSTDGIVEEDVEKTIENFAVLGNKGSVYMDKLVLNMMINKQKA